MPAFFVKKMLQLGAMLCNFAIVCGIVCSRRNYYDQDTFRCFWWR